MPYLQFAVSIDSLESLHAVLAVSNPSPLASFDRHRKGSLRNLHARKNVLPALGVTLQWSE